MWKGKKERSDKREGEEEEIYVEGGDEGNGGDVKYLYLYLSANILAGL
jgi:hypothetical protein